MMNARERAIAAFENRFEGKPALLAFAPGRVNLLGEHVDYNAGLVLPAAIDRATWVAFTAAESGQISLWAADFEEPAVFTAAEARAGEAARGATSPRWALYPAGVAWGLSDEGLDVRGLKAAFASDVPRGSGLSSSASVEVAFAAAWGAAGDWSLPPLKLAQVCQRAENEYVGVACGLMDQFASVCGSEGQILCLDCRSLEWSSAVLPPGATLVIADTSVRRSLADSAYNERREACEEAVRLLQRTLTGIQSLRDVSPEAFEGSAAALPPLIAKRARHVVEEIARTGKAISVLERGDCPALGRLMNECHASLRDLYEVSCTELDTMVAIAQSLDGCFGARMTGAGFGGCTVNLAQTEMAAGFARALAYRYEKETGLQAQVFLTRPAPGAGVRLPP